MASFCHRLELIPFRKEERYWNMLYLCVIIGPLIVWLKVAHLVFKVSENSSLKRYIFLSKAEQSRLFLITSNMSLDTVIYDSEGLILATYMTTVPKQLFEYSNAKAMKTTSNDITVLLVNWNLSKKCRFDLKKSVVGQLAPMSFHNSPRLKKANYWWNNHHDHLREGCVKVKLAKDPWITHACGLWKRW